MTILNIRPFNGYKIAIFISTLSMMLGILREFFIVWLFGFTSTNDHLQLYLSIFYTVGLSLDGIRLSCLNLYPYLSLQKIIFSVSVVGLPFCLGIGFILSYFANHLNLSLLLIAIVGSYLNLIVTLLVAYKQRNNSFLTAQLITALPNFIFIPGILIFYFFSFKNLILLIVCLASFIPILQCFILLFIPQRPVEKMLDKSLSVFESIRIVIKHMTSMLGEQLFQIIIRTAFYNYGAGYLSLLALTTRIYSTTRIIFVDSFIGSKLANWKNDGPKENKQLLKMIYSTPVGISIALLGLIVSLQPSNSIFYFATQLIILFIMGFYLSSLVRIIYFKINHHEINSPLIIRYTIYELIGAFLAFLLTKLLDYPILELLWLGYIMKPFYQLLFLRKNYIKILST